MRLELQTFEVREIELRRGTGTSRLSAGRLEIAIDDFLGVLRKDRRLLDVGMEIARPGDSVRVAGVQDVLEPRVKVAGDGVAFPGVDGRSVATVGNGRTNRLSGIAVAECAPLSSYGGIPGWETVPAHYIEMSGPLAIDPYSSLHLLCVCAVPDPDLPPKDQSEAAWAAALHAADYLARLTTTESPDHVETFELRPLEPDLPRVAYFPHYYSPHHYAASYYAFGTAIYGTTGLTLPWLLHPNEFLDGAVTRSGTWLHQNHPQILDLYARHGESIAFVGAIAQRTRWTSMKEKRLVAEGAAKIASMLGVDGAILTWDSGGNDFVEVAYLIEACEKRGIKTVLMTTEELEAGTLGSVLYLPPGADAIVSCGGARDRDRTVAAARVIGFDENMTPPATGGASVRLAFGEDDFYGLRELSGFDA